MRFFRLIPLAAALAAVAAHAQTIDRMKLTDGELSCVQIYAETHQMDAVIALNANNPARPPAAAPVPAAPATAAPVPGNDPVASGFASALAGAFGNSANLGAAGGLAPNPSGIPVGVYADPNVQASIQRARAAGYSDAQINQIMQMGAARAGYPVAATAGGRYQMAGMQGALAAGQAAQAAALAGQAVPAPAPAPAAAAAAAAPALGGFLGALTGRAGLGGAQAGNLLGAALQGAAAPAPAPAAAPVPPQVVAAAPAPAAGNVPLAAQARARKEHLTSLFLSKGCKVSDMPK